MDDADRGALLGRGLDAIFDPELRRSIGKLLDDVQTRGDAAVCDALARFDGVTIAPDQLRVTADEIARRVVAPATSTQAIDDAIAHIRRSVSTSSPGSPTGASRPNRASSSARS